jgi:hypothetical protein
VVDVRDDRDVSQVVASGHAERHLRSSRGSLRATARDMSNGAERRDLPMVGDAAPPAYRL